MSLVKNYEDENGLHFTLKDVNVSVANGIRRVILSEIPVVAIRTETADINQCQITVNTSRFHNEIVKQRLSCVPIYVKDLRNLTDFVENHRLWVDVKNETSHEMKWVTTDDFRIQNNKNDQYLSEEETRKLYPRDPITNQPIDFLRLRPMIGSIVDGEHIQLSANFSISNAKENGMFNVVSKCAHFNVIDPQEREEVWAIKLQSLQDEGRTEEEIDFEKKNFQYLDAERCYKKDENGEANEFEFIVKTVGVYSNYEIVYSACDILKRKFDRFAQDVQSQVVPIHKSIDTKDLGYTSVTIPSIENSFDVILEEEDFTMGYLLEYYLYKLYYQSKDQSNEMTFVGFKKYHPHDSYSVIRMAFKELPSAQLLLKQILVQTAMEISKLLEDIKKQFSPFVKG
jgi:DNA-directed RNA polymerase alpha subunit